MKSAKTSKNNPWETTNTACLLRHKPSRVYYGRFTLRGKQKWVNLDTTVLTVAKLRLPDEIKKMEAMRATPENVSRGKATVGELMDTYLKYSRQSKSLRPASIVSRETAVKKIKKTWPGIELLPANRITVDNVYDWATRFKMRGTGFVPPKAKTASLGNSPTSVNRAIETLRKVLDIAVEEGQIHSNPVSAKPTKGRDRLRSPIKKKKLVLPSHTDAARLIKSMWEAGQHGGWGVEASYLCRFLMMSGARIGEIPVTTWKDINREGENKTIWLPGYKTETSARFVPLHEDLEFLLGEIVTWRQAVAKRRKDGNDFLAKDDAIFRIKECQKTIDAACVATGVMRITHHDFRHLFATRCIEMGVDIPTVAKWLGHKDGGLLVMATYAHLRDDHSQASAKKLKFGKFQ